MTARMFPFVTDTWNPVKGCTHGCSYCWARDFSRRIYADGFALKLFPERLRYTKKNQTVFVCDMGDLFCDGVPDEWIQQVIDAIRKADKSNKFLFLTKNPARYKQFQFPDNCTLGATIETNRDISSDISIAPLPSERISAMANAPSLRRFVCIEPVMDFDSDVLIQAVTNIAPGAVAVGYDNYNHGLPEPSLSKTQNLVTALRAICGNVYTKTMREAVL